MRRLLRILLILFSPVAFAQTRGFQNPPLLATASDPAAIATGDWNGDGKPDLAYIDSASTPSLHVLEGSGNGRFSEVQTLVLPASSCSYLGSTHGCFLQQADVDGDGLQDFVFAYVNSNETGVLSVLFGQKGGTFSPPIQTPIPLNYLPPSPLNIHMAIGDFTGDGKVDVALADIYDSRLLIMRGDGTGTFQTINTLNLSSLTYATVSGVYAGDFNQDGKLDLMLYCRYYGAVVVILYGDGTGKFSAPSDPSVGSMTAATVLADATGDGILDIAGFSGNDAYLVPGQVNGSFGTPVDVPSGNKSNTSLIGVANLNGDMYPDLLSLSPAGLALQLGKGQTAFDTSQLLIAGATATNLFASADFNGDGFSDVAVGVAGGIQFIFGNASGSFASNGIVDTGAAVGAILGGDFNGDGRADVAVMQPASAGLNGVRTLLSSPAGVLTPGPQLTLSTQGGISASTGAVADFDGDGRQDIVLNGGPMQFLYGNGDGSFTETIASTYAGSRPFVADLNRDGKPDVVVMNGPYSDASFNEYYKLVSLVNGGSRTFTEVDTSLEVTYFNPDLLAVGDLNGDGYADAVIYEENEPGIRVLLGSGDGTFHPGASLMLNTTLSGLAAKIADMDGDGHQDLVLIAPQSNGVASNLMVFYGDGAGNLGAPQITGLSHLYTAGFQVIDVDRTGLLDVVASGGGLVGVLRNLGARNFGSESRIIAGAYPTGVIADDFNADGYPDIVVIDSMQFAASSSTLVTELLNSQIAGQGSAASLDGIVSATPSSPAYNQAFVVSVAFSANGGGLPPAPTGSVQFSVDGAYVCTGTVANLAASCLVPGTFTTTLAPGSHTLAASYSGDTSFAPGVFTGSLTTLAPNYVTTTTLTASSTANTAGQFVTLVAAVSAPVTVNQGIVVFYDGTSILGQVAISANAAVLQTNLLNTGTNTLSAVYLGYTYPNTGIGKPYSYQSSKSNAVAVLISAIPTSTSLAASSASLTNGGVLTLTAKVSATTTPFGSVTFSDSGAAIGTVVLDSTGTAMLSTVSLANGVHNLVAVYAANDPFGSSSSSASSVTVNVITSSLPATYTYIDTVTRVNNVVQLGARVVSTSGGTAQGTLTFLEDNQIVATQLLSAVGRATYSLDAGSATEHAFYVSYSGSAMLAPSASPLVPSEAASGSDFSMQISSNAPDPASPLSDGIAVKITGGMGWSGVSILGCTTGIPDGYSCQFSPAAIAGSGTSQLRFVPLSVGYARIAEFLAAVCVMPLVFRRRRLLSKATGVLLLALCGCSLGGHLSSPKPTVVTVQATSGEIIHAAQILVR